MSPVRFFQRLGGNGGFAGELLLFLWAKKIWWLIPMLSIFLLFALLLISASSNGVGPFIYTLF